MAKSNEDLWERYVECVHELRKVHDDAMERFKTLDGSQKEQEREACKLLRLVRLINQIPHEGLGSVI